MINGGAKMNPHTRETPTGKNDFDDFDQVRSKVATARPYWYDFLFKI
jgi:hypothetical protein